MHTATFAISMPLRFRGIQRREGVLMRGPAGWAEFSPFLDYDDPECVPWLRSAMDSATRPWPEPRRATVPVNATVPAVDGATARRIVERSGCATAKVKVAEPGQSLDDDLARVAAVREALGATGLVRVDANGGWSLEEAEHAVALLDAEVGLEYVEQPCATVEELAELRRRTDVPVAADESIRRADDPYRVRDAEAADVAVLKVQPLGGVHACLRIAEEIGLPVVVSSAVETSVGLAAGVALAAALPELPHACGLGTTSLLDADVVAEALVPVDGVLPVGRVEVDAAALDAVRPDATTDGAWWARLERVAALVPEAQELLR
ncbi:o-succinylbenzoate synthase [Aeromicrobium halocynthiae]|uniref:o-succinylbenzoate synthase n=1 Tax=Aeromicrobium halocynthiae TaxID=560557 RepID=A0ABP5HJ99_9ACTN